MDEAPEIILSLAGSKRKPEGWGGEEGRDISPKTKTQDHHRSVYGASYLMAIALEVQGCFDTFPGPKVASRSTRLNGTDASGGSK